MSEVVRVGLQLDLADAKTQLESFRTEFEGLKQSFKDAPNATEAFNEGVNRSIDLIDMLSKKIDKTKESESDNDLFQKDIQSALEELSAMKKLYSSNGAFSVNAVKGMFSGLSASVQRELNTATNEIASMIRTSIHSLRSSTITGMASELIRTDTAQGIFKNFKSVDGQVFKKYIEALLPRVAPAFMFDDYNLLRYGTTHVGSRNTNPQNLIPKSFLSSYQKGAYVSSSNQAENMYMQHNQRQVLRKIIEESDAAFRAAEATKGMMQYSNSGKASLIYGITPRMYDEFRKNLFDDFVRRSSGMDSRRIDMFDSSLSDVDQRRLVARMTSSSAGRALKAMDQIDALSAIEDLWTASPYASGYQQLAKEAKRSLEQYEVAKYTFDSLYNKTGRSSRVSISESPNTRMLGLQGHHNEFTDKVLLVSAQGWDQSNAEQNAFMEQLLDKKKPIEIPGTGKKYIAQNLHGTGEHTVVRMVEAEAYEAVRQREEARLQEELNNVRKQFNLPNMQGFTGTNFWNDFIADDYDFKDIQKLRKHYDATGKGWSGGYKVHSNWENKAFGVVNISRINNKNIAEKLADGLAWFTDGIMPVEDFQGRMAVAGKGTSHTLKGFSTIGEWARAVGLADENGELWLPGPRGMVNVTNLHGITDISQLKNVEAYDNFQTPEEFNAAYTAAMRLYGASVMASYEDAETRARGLGPQAMAFINLSPELQKQQMLEFDRRMKLLDTEAGIRELLFADPDNYLGQQLRAGKITTKDWSVQSWARNEKESLINRISSGEWIDFGESPSVVNQMLNKSFLSTIIEHRDTDSREETLRKIREAYAKTKYAQEHGTELNLTDEELAGVFTLDKGQIVDFSHPDEDLVSVIRSPSLFGNFIYGKNYAKLAKPIYEAFGQSTSGGYLSMADMDTIGDADWDGDRAKFMYGEIAQSVKESAELDAKLIKELGDYPEVTEKAVELAGIANYIDTGKNAMLTFGALANTGYAIGQASEGGMRASMMDLANPLNKDYLIAAVQANRAYALATAQAKKGTEVQLPQQLKHALYLNKQWSRLPSRYSRIFNTTGKDGLDIPDESDIANIKIGDQNVAVNLAELRELGLDKINFRSIYNSSDLRGLQDVMYASRNGWNMTGANAILQALDQYVGYGDAGEKTKALMQNLRMMKVYDMMNPGGLMDDEALGNLEIMINAANDEIKKQAQQLYPDDRKTFESYVKTKQNEYGISAAEDFLTRGIHKRNLYALYGENEEVRKNLPLLFSDQRAQLQLPNAPVYDEMQRVNVEKEKTLVDAKNKEIDERNKEIQVRKDRIADLEKETNKDENIRNEREQLDKEILEEETRLKEERGKKIKLHEDEMNKNDFLYGKENPYKIPTKEELEQRIEEDNKKIKDEKKQLESEKESFDLTDWSHYAASAKENAQKYIKQHEQNIQTYTEDIELVQKSLDAYYGELHSPKLDELKAKRDALGKTQEQITLENEVKNLETQQISAIEQRDQSAALIKQTYDYIAAQEQYNSLMTGAGDYYNQLTNSLRRKTGAIEETPGAQLYYERNLATAYYHTNALKRFGQSENFKRLSPEEQVALNELISDSKGLVPMAEKEFAATTELRAKQAYEYFDKAYKKQDGPASTLELQFKKYDEKLQNARDYRNQLWKNLEKGELQKKDKNEMLENYHQATDNLTLAEKAMNKLKETNITSALDKYKTQFDNPFEKIAAGAEEAKANVTDLMNLFKKELKNQGFSDEEISDKLKPYEGLIGSIDRRTQSQIEIQKLQQQYGIDQFIRQGQTLNGTRYGLYRNNGFAARIVARQNSAIAQAQQRQIAAKTQLEKAITYRDSIKDKDSTEYSEAAKNVADLQQEATNAEAAITNLSSSFGTASAVASQFGEAIGRVAQRLGRQLFHKALQETKRFVQEFDASMNEIQTITLKSDQEMQTIRKDTISKAIELRTPVSNVAATEAALYRQGLSDQEVKSRTESIIKFATVTKLNVGEATKIITTALQNDLVKSAEEAMDVLVALGDSAATTAAKIGKGMQKAAASAKVAGVSYAELTALLTIGTSDTQLSGTQVGTALQTVFSRMRRLSLSGYAADLNGEKTTASDAEAALRSIGVDLWDNKTAGKMRSSYAVLRDIAKVWETLSDAQKSVVTNALAGTRQTNIFSTLMEGMGENGGENLDKYLGLAGDSEGVTQTKYEIAMQSLQAAIDEVRSSWDALIAAFTNNGMITGALDSVSGILQWVTGIAERGGQIGTVLSGVAAGIAAIWASVKLFSSASIPGFLINLLSVGAGLFVGASGLSLTSLLTPKNEDQLREERKASFNKETETIKANQTKEANARSSAIEKVKELGKAYDELSKSASKAERLTAETNLINGLHNLKIAFPEVSDAILDAIQNLSKWKEAVKEADDAGRAYLTKNATVLGERAIQYLRENSESDYEKALEENMPADAYDIINKVASKRGTFLEAKTLDDIYDKSRGASTGEIASLFAEIARYAGTPGFNSINGALADNSFWKFLTSGNIDINNSSPNEPIDYYSLFINTEDAQKEIDRVRESLKTEYGRQRAKEDARFESAISPINDRINELLTEKTGGNLTQLDEEVATKELAAEKAHDAYVQTYVHFFDNLNSAQTEYLEANKRLKAAQESLQALQDQYNERTDGDVSDLEAQIAEATSSFSEAQNDVIVKKQKLDEAGEAYKSAELMIAKLKEDADKKQAEALAAAEERDRVSSEEQAKLTLERGHGGGYKLVQAFADLDEETRVHEANVEKIQTDYQEKLDSIENDYYNFTLRSMFGSLANFFNGNETERTANKRAISVEFMKQMTGQMGDYLSQISNDKYTVEFMMGALDYYLSENVDKYVDKKGNLDRDAVINFLEGFLYTQGYEGGFVQKGYKAFEDLLGGNLNLYPYHVGDQGFFSLDEARQYAERNNISYSEIMDKDGNSTIQSARNSANAVILNANASNAEERRREFYENVSRAQSMEQLEDIYNKTANGQIFASELESNSMAAAAYQTYLAKTKGIESRTPELFEIKPTTKKEKVNITFAQQQQRKILDQSWKEFQELINNIKEGNTSLIIDYYKSQLGDKTFAQGLQDEGVYEDVESLFKSYYGEDLGLKILNAAADGMLDGLDSSLKTAMQNIEAQNKIKEKFQHYEGYDQFAESAVAIATGSSYGQLNIQNEKRNKKYYFAEYNDALSRYENGNMRDEDYATLAQYSGISEILLRNGYDANELRGNYNTAYDYQMYLYNKEFQSAITGAGYNWEDFLDENGEWNVRGTGSILKILKQYKDAGFTIDKNGMLQWNLPSMPELSREAINQSYTSEFDNIYGTIYDNLIAGNMDAFMDQLNYKPDNDYYLRQQYTNNPKNFSLWLNKKGITVNDIIPDDRQYNYLLENDPAFNAMVFGGAGIEYIIAHLNNQRLGREDSLSTGFQSAVDALFGGKVSKETIYTARQTYQNATDKEREWLKVFVSMLPSSMQELIIDGTGNKDTAFLDYLTMQYQDQYSYLRPEMTLEVAQQKAQYEAGTETDKANIIGNLLKYYKDLQTAQFAYENYGSNEAADNILSQITGLENLDTLMVGDNQSKEMVQSTLNEAVTNYMLKLALMFTDTSGTSIDKTKLQQEFDKISGALDEDVKGLIEGFLSIFDELGNIVGQTSFPSLESILSSRTGSDTRRIDTLNAIGSIINKVPADKRQEEYAKLLNSQNYDWSNVSSVLQYAVKERSTGSATITDDVIGSIYQSELYGRTISPETQKTILSSLFGGDLSANNVSKTYAAWMTSGQNQAELDVFGSLSGLDEITNALAIENESTRLNALTVALKKYDDELKARSITYSRQFGESTDEVAESFKNLAAGGKKATQEVAKIKVRLLDYQDAMTAIGKARGKNGRDVDSVTKGIIANLLGVDDKAINDYTKEALNNVLDKIEENINTEFNEDTFQPFLSGISDVVNERIANNELTVEQAVSIVTKINESGDLSGFEELLGSKAQEYADIVKAMAGILAEYNISISQEDGENGTRIVVTGNADVKGGNNYKHASGGGGGGKSPLDKLLEAQKRKLTSIEHENTMLSIQTEEAARINNLPEYNRLIDEQIEGQTKLRDAYKENLDELNKQLSKLKEESDDWWKVKEAINAAEEAVAKYNANIAEIESKRLQEVREKYDYESGLNTHEGNMLGIENRAQRRLNDYTGWRENIVQRAANMQEQIAKDELLIEELQAALDKETEGENGESDYARKLREEINGLIEKVATLSEDIKDLSNEAIEINTTLKNNELITPTHLANVYATQGEIYRRNGDWTKASEQYDLTIKNNVMLREIYNHDIAENTRLLNSEDTVVGSSEWFELLKLIYESQEAILNLTLSEMDIDNQRLNDIRTYNERELNPLQHNSTMLGYEMERYIQLNDYDAYLDAIEKDTQNHKDLIATLQDQKDHLIEQQALVEEGTDAWWDYEKEIQNVTAAIEENMRAIEENNKKQLEALKIKQENEDKPENHAFDMMALAEERADLLDDYDMWEAIQLAKVEEIKKSIAQNKKQLAEAEALLATFVTGSQEWIDTRDLIWDIKKDIAQKENEALKIELEIDKRRLEEIKKAEERRSKPDKHAVTMLDTASRVYQSFGNYDNYRESLTKQYDAYQNIRDSALEARDAAIAEMDTLEKGSVSWYNAMDAVYAYDEAVQSATNAMLEKQLAIEAANISQAMTEFSNAQLENSTKLQIVRIQRQQYDNANDFENYQKSGQEEKEILDQQIEDRKQYVNTLIELLKDTTKNTQNWQSLRSTISQEITSIASMQAESDNISRQMEQTKIDHMLEKMDYEDSNRQHNLTLIQYEQTKYQNAGQLSNYGIMLQKENDLRRESIEANERDIETLKAEQDQLEKGSKEYNRLTEAIKKKEEAISSDTVELERNSKAIEENANAIKKARKDLEDTVDNEIKTREQERKDRLKAEVDLQKTLLETIKQRYTDEWNLEKEDFNKKKEALEKEKSLIKERLDARKEAMNTEEKYRELEELQRQLALISNDPTRTKDAKELREKINKIEKDISWDKAFKEADAATQQIDDEIQAINDYTTDHEENLNEMLENANNFSAQIEEIMAGGWESVSSFLIENNKEFKNSLDEAQQQMLEGWEQTWKDMNGIVDTYWDQINETISSYTKFIEYMKDSSEYINASEAGKAVLEYAWKTLFEDNENATIISADAENYQLHEHPWYEVISDAVASLLEQYGDWYNYGKEPPEEAISSALNDFSDYTDLGVDERDHLVELTDIEFYDTYDNYGVSSYDYSGGVSNFTPMYDQDGNTIGYIANEPERPTVDNTEKKPVKEEPKQENAPKTPTIQEEKKEEQPKETPKSETAANEKKADSPKDTEPYIQTIGPTSSAYDYNKPTATSGKPYAVDISGSKVDAGNVNANISSGKNVKSDLPSLPSKEEQAANTQKEAAKNNVGSLLDTVKNSAVNLLGNLANLLSDALKNATIKPSTTNSSTLKYAEGGLVDYTGVAWVDGTFAKPESFLDAEDTQALMDLTDMLTFVDISRGLWPNLSEFSHGDTNFGNINIVINQAEIKDDADIDALARRLGKSFTKEISKKGYNLTGYNM